MQQQQQQSAQKQMTANKSLLAVKTLLQAGIGCICYIRSLLPDDASQMCYLGSESSEGRRQSSDNVRIRMLKRGYSTEVDRLLDYLDLGIFDALQKQYLRSFIFAIYLDSEDPNNLIEAYTFNFAYHTPEGGDSPVPIMTLGPQFEQLSLSNKNGVDPLTTATVQGKVPTVGDVKASVKGLLKRIISMTETLADLPRRRFATFKLYYYPNTPSDYEPPMFIPGDVDRDRFFFTTHREKEVPEKVPFGFMDSVFHTVGVEVSSVVNYIPPRETHNNEFNSGKVRTDVEMATILEKETKKQLQDAVERNVVWDADGSALNIKNPSSRRRAGQRMSSKAPIGVRKKQGDLHIFEDNHPQGTFWGDLSQTIEDNSGLQIDEMDYSPCDQTQAMECSPAPQSNRDGVPLPMTDDIATTQPARPVSPEPTNNANIDATPSSPSPSQVQTNRDKPGSNMPMDTPPTIQPQLKGHVSVRPRKTSINPEQREVVQDDLLDCICGDAEDDGGRIYCDAGCGKGYHIWCIGYNSCDDPRLPDNFECYRCMLASSKYGLLTRGERELSLAGLKRLALTRRALKVIMDEGPPEGDIQFGKRLGCEMAVAAQITKGLINEGFLALEHTVTDELGFVETRTTAPVTRQATQKQNRPKRGRPKNPKLVVIKTDATNRLMERYFKPGNSLERSVIFKKKAIRNQSPVTLPTPLPATNEEEKYAASTICDSPSRLLHFSSTSNHASSSRSLPMEHDDNPSATNAPAPPSSGPNEANLQKNLDKTSDKRAAVIAKTKRKISSTDSRAAESPVLKKVKLSMAAKPMDLEEEEVC